MDKTSHSENRQTTTLGGGCYWCIDAVLRDIKGIVSLSSGFCGGEDPNPSYESVCSGQSEHIEVVQVSFDADILPFEQLLAIFFAAHDPTQRNGQGNDIGPQYRSVIFCHDESQQQCACEMIDRLNTSGIYHDDIATEVRSKMPFYPGPEYHQDFYRNAPHNPYCQIVIRPKMDKIRRLFAAELKQ